MHPDLRLREVYHDAYLQVRTPGVEVTESVEALWNAHVEAYCRADVHYRAGRYRLALREFTRALALWSDDSDTLWAIGNCHGELSRPRLAERAFRKALTTADPEKRDALLFNLGNALFDQGKFTAAVRVYDRISPKAPVAPSAGRNRQLCATRRSNKPLQGSLNSGVAAVSAP
jgi:tetratricopeptide (TPR) repeat protein